MAGEDNVSRNVQLVAKPPECRANSIKRPALISVSVEYEANFPRADHFLQHGLRLAVEL